MKKYKVLTHLREVIGINTHELSSEINMPEIDVIAIEHGIQSIPPKITKYYSHRLNIDKSIMDILFKDFGKKNRIISEFQDIALHIILKYLELGKWMCSFNETRKS